MTQANTNTTSVLFYAHFCLREEVILLYLNPVKTEGDGKGEGGKGVGIYPPETLKC